MKLIIAGSREITDISHVLVALGEAGLSAQDVTEIVSGGATGVDRLGEQVAEDFNIPIKYVLAEWTKYGKRAGMIRNKEMGRYADQLVAVWDGKSKGTKNMIDYMNELGKEVYIHYVR